MRRFNQNLAVAMAVLGMALVSSAAFAHGGGGGGSFGGHSGGSFSRGQSGASRSVSSVQRSTRNYVNIANPGNGTVGRNPGRNPPARHRWPPYHMHYPVRFWLGGHFDVADVVEGGIDVEFTSIRQLDAGDPAKGLAPAYRVWFHNNTDVDINQPFDVAILAANEQTLSADLPYAAVRVDGMAADETMSVDIRLPIAAMSMGSADGQPASYTYLHTIIDSQNELVETNKANNFAVFAQKDIPMLGD